MQQPGWDDLRRSFASLPPLWRRPIRS
ncbi:protein of unknown function [Cyanobium sp. NIES-981]|nr:protein of unknown function [Cyanobium sp. NIES-981]